MQNTWTLVTNYTQVAKKYNISDTSAMTTWGHHLESHKQPKNSVYTRHLEQAEAVQACEATAVIDWTVAETLQAAVKAELLEVGHVVVVRLHGVGVGRRQLNGLSSKHVVEVARVRVRLDLRLKRRCHLQGKTSPHESNSIKA